MRIVKLALVPTAMVALTVPATANAATQYFQTPSGNIACMLDADGVSCDIADYTYTPPPPPECAQHISWGDRFTLTSGKPAVIECHGDTVRLPGERTLNYGQTASAGSITCLSEESGVKCTDSSSGHFFRVARDAFKLG